MKKILSVIAGILLVILTLAVICFKPLDKTPYQQTGFYKKEMALIDSVVSIQTDKTSDSVLLIGWSSVNLLPPFSTPIAIDAHRNGKHFEGVHDSIYVRAFVFKQGKKKIAYISADLLIIPPTVTRMFDTLFSQQGFNQNNIYFTATHTHTSIGAWYNSIVGEIFAGKYDARVPEFIATQIAKAITEAEKKCSPATIGYGEFPTQKLVFNRLVTQMAHLPDSLGKVDSLIRIVKIENEQGQKAAIITFAAHNTVFHESLMNLSGDWCGQMMKQLNESGKINFASFSAGEVGSHGPYEKTKDQEAEAKYMADGVAQIVLQNFDSIKTNHVGHINMIHLPLYLREPNLRITESIVIRPWLFKKLFGDEQVYMNTLQLGSVTFAGMPCDFSGELIGETDSVADSLHLQLVVTSFNGGYIGYITRSQWYNLNTYETRTMGWFGDKNGEYLNEILNKLISQASLNP